MPGIPWFDDDEFEFDELRDDPADWWKPVEHKWQDDPNAAFNKEFTDTVVEKAEQQLQQFTIHLLRNWRSIANAFHAVSKTPFEAFRDQVTEPPALLVNAPKLYLCVRPAECGKHLRNKPVYLPDEKTIHVTPGCAQRMKHVFGMNYEDNPMPFYIDDCMGQSIHHQLNPDVFKPRERFSLEDLEARTLVGCVERLARLFHHPYPVRELPGLYRFEHKCIKNYAKALRRKSLAEVAGTIRSNHRAELFRHGFGRVYANDLEDLDRKAGIDDAIGMSFGDGGVGSPADIMRIIAPAQDLPHAAELLFQRAEGPKVEYASKGLWSRVKVFYAAVAYNFTALHNFFEKAASKKQL